MKTFYFKFLGILIVLMIAFVGCDKTENDIAKSKLSVLGTLVYNDSRGGWEIRETIPNAIDSTNIYIIAKEYAITYPKDSTLKVKATGLYSLHPDQTGIPAGTGLYDLYIEHITETE